MIHFFDNILYAISGPIVFVFLNSLFVFYPEVGKVIGCPDKKRNLGLVYYPFSLIILILLVYLGDLELYAATVGVFAMGYGDGFAAILGFLYGDKKIPLATGGKTYLGSIVMLFVCIVSSFIIFSFMSDSTFLIKLLASILIGVAASLIEVISPLGFDNISVPLFVTLLAGGLVWVRDFLEVQNQVL